MALYKFISDISDHLPVIFYTVHQIQTTCPEESTIRMNDEPDIGKFNNLLINIDWSEVMLHVRCDASDLCTAYSSLFEYR